MASPPLVFYCSLLFIFTSKASADNFSVAELDSTILDLALKELQSVRARTGILYQVPANILNSGVKASAIRLRAGNIWSKGANTTAFSIPPRTVPVPYVKRLLIVYQNLGDQSSSYFSIPGYSLASPIVGLLAYNASDTRAQLDLNATVEHIVISLVPGVQNSSSIKCGKFRQDGSVQISDLVEGGRMSACLTRSTGHFAMIVPSGAAASGERRRSRWWGWACGAGGVVGVALLGLVGLGIFKRIRNKKMEAMADEGEPLRSVWVGESKMPSATLMIRTQPVLETGN